MKTHFIYNRKTGQIIHVHVSDEAQDVSKEGLLHKVGTEFRKTDFDVHSVDGFVEPVAYRFDVQKKVLVKDKSKDTAFGTAGMVKPGQVSGFAAVKTTYKKV